MTTVVALGGNALTRQGERGTAAEQLANVRAALPALAPLLEEPRVVVTHGNGPQVGRMLRRHELAADEVAPHPLWLTVAETQAEIGALVEAELRSVAARPVACLLTHVRVDQDDPAFAAPTKPIGSYYSAEQARELERDRGWTLVSDSGRGYRRTVASPRPLEVVELEPIRTLVEAGTIAIACGGGGIPVVARDGELHGVDAVIDKDLASALLARELGASRLLILTDVDAVYRDFGTAHARPLRELSADEAEALLPTLAAGSMQPKLEAAIAFAREAGGETVVTSAEALGDALDGRAGTRIVP